jgi:hypothetical protein
MRATIEVTANDFRFLENRNSNGNGEHEATTPDRAPVGEAEGEKAALPF